MVQVREEKESELQAATRKRYEDEALRTKGQPTLKVSLGDFLLARKAPHALT